jgi:hypothetical protein
MAERRHGDRMTIHVHIDRLVLEGVPVSTAQGPVVQAAVEAELARLLTLADGGGPRVAWTSSTVPRVQAPGVELAARERPDSIGRRVARSVHAGLRGMR